MSEADVELVLGLPRTRIIGDVGWKGIRDESADGVLDLIATEAEYRPRAEAELDPSWKQVIPYLLMRDRGRLFLMQRSKAGGDDRLHDRWSIGIGGHLNPEDGGVEGGLLREFHEEMVADWEPEPRLLGLLNDDDVLVGQVHLGVAFEAEADGRPLAIRETHKLSGEFVALEDVVAVYDRMETWSQLLYDHVTGGSPDRTGGPRSQPGVG